MKNYLFLLVLLLACRKQEVKTTTPAQTTQQVTQSTFKIVFHGGTAKDSISWSTTLPRFNGTNGLTDSINKTYYIKDVPHTFPYDQQWITSTPNYKNGFPIPTYTMTLYKNNILIGIDSSRTNHPGTQIDFTF